MELANVPSSAKDLLDLAIKLHTKNINEVEVRASISRSYYSAYHHTLDFLNGSNPITWSGGEGGVHSKLITSLTQNSNTKEKRIGYILQALKAKRVIADYYLLDSLSSEDSGACIKDVERLLLIMNE